MDSHFKDLEAAITRYDSNTKPFGEDTIEHKEQMLEEYKKLARNYRIQGLEKTTWKLQENRKSQPKKDCRPHEFTHFGKFLEELYEMMDSLNKEENSNSLKALMLIISEIVEENKRDYQKAK